MIHPPQVLIKKNDTINTNNNNNNNIESLTTSLSYVNDE